MVRALINLASWSLVPSRADLLLLGLKPRRACACSVETYRELLGRTHRSAPRLERSHGIAAWPSRDRPEAGIEVTDSIPIEDIADTTESRRLPPWVSLPRPTDLG